MKTSNFAFSCLLLAVGLAQGNDVVLSPTWNFFNPEGLSVLSNESATGFDFNIRDIVGNVQEDAVAVTSITADGGSSGILVTAPGHGVPAAGNITAYIHNTSVAAYNSDLAGPHTANHVDANTLAIPTLAYTADATGGTIGASDLKITGGNAVRPRVYQTFGPVDLSAIGAAFSCQFDLELLGWSQDRNTIRLCWGDTVKNAEFNGLCALGQYDNRDDGLKIRLDNLAFNLPPYNTSNPYEGAMGSSGNSWNVEAHFPQPNGSTNNNNRLQKPGTVNRYYLTLVRVSATEFSVLLKWQIVTDEASNPPFNTNKNDSWFGNGTEVYVLRYDETTGTIADTGFTAGTSDAWGGAGAAAGALNQIDFLGFMVHDDNPFGNSGTNPAGNDSGGMRITNLRVGTSNYFELLGLTGPVGVTLSPSGSGTDTNVNLTWNSFQDSTSSGSKYAVTAVDDPAEFPTAQVFASGIPADSSGLTTWTDLEPIPLFPKQFYRLELDQRPPAD